MREICFDTETTGLDPKSGDRITEIGCVEIVDRKITGNTFREIINPDRKNSLESIQITGLTDEILKDKPFFSDIVDNFLEFIGDSIVNFVVADLAYSTYKKMNQGELSKVRAGIVKSSYLADKARLYHFEDYIKLGHSLPDNTRNSRRILEDVFEAFIGAVYIDSDYNNASALLDVLLKKHILFH